MTNQDFRTPMNWEFPGIIKEAMEIMDIKKKGHLFNRKTGMPLIALSTKTIDFVKLPWNELEKFADAVTSAFPDAVATNLNDAMKTDLHYTNLGLTDLGNLAFISSHAVMPSNRKSAKKFLSAYLEIFKGPKYPSIYIKKNGGSSVF